MTVYAQSLLYGLWCQLFLKRILLVKGKVLTKIKCNSSSISKTEIAVVIVVEV